MKNSKEVFSYSLEEMSGIDPKVITHKLKVDPSYPPVKQKQRRFAQCETLSSKMKFKVSYKLVQLERSSILNG